MKYDVLPTATSIVDWTEHNAQRELIKSLGESGMIAGLRGKPAFVHMHDAWISGWRRGRELRLAIVNKHGLTISIVDGTDATATRTVD